MHDRVRTSSIRQSHVSPFLVIPLALLRPRLGQKDVICAFAKHDTTEGEQVDEEPEDASGGPLCAPPSAGLPGTLQVGDEVHREAAFHYSSRVDLWQLEILWSRGLYRQLRQSAARLDAIDDGGVPAYAGRRPFESVASLRDGCHAAIHDALRRHRATVRVLHPGDVRDAECLDGRSGGRCGARRSGRADPRPAERSSCRICSALAAIPKGQPKPADVLVGQTAAVLILQRRADDGVAEAFATPYLPTGVPGDYDFHAAFRCAAARTLCFRARMGRGHAVWHRPSPASAARAAAAPKRGVRGRSCFRAGDR